MKLHKTRIKVITRQDGTIEYYAQVRCRCPFVLSYEGVILPNTLWWFLFPRWWNLKGTGIIIGEYSDPVQVDYYGSGQAYNQLEKATSVIEKYLSFKRTEEEEYENEKKRTLGNKMTRKTKKVKSVKYYY